MSGIGSRPRSTPIPGGETFLPGNDGLPGDAGHHRTDTPPTPTEFVDAQGFAPPPGAATPTLPGMTVQDYTFVALDRRRRRSPFGWLLMAIVLGTGPVIGIGGGVWAFLKARDAVEHASELSDATLSRRDRDPLGLGDDVETLFQADAPLRVASLFEDMLPGEPTRFTQILLYPYYAFATVQDPTQPTHLDQYTWRSGALGTPSAQQSSADLEFRLFGAGDVNWVAVAQIAAQAPALTDVEGGSVSHIVVERSTFQPTLAAVVRIFVNGDRGSGFVEVGHAGDILAVH